MNRTGKETTEHVSSESSQGPDGGGLSNFWELESRIPERSSHYADEVSGVTSWSSWGRTDRFGSRQEF